MHDWQFLNMIFNDKYSKITYYDRTNIEIEKRKLEEELEELEEEYYHNYGVYYGAIFPTEEEINLKTKIEDIKNVLFDIYNMEEDKELFIIDKAIREDLLLPKDENKLIRSDETYDIYDVTNNSSIKVYKKIIRKI